MTLRSRLTLAFVLVVLTPLLIGLVVVSIALPRAVQRQQQQGAASSARLVGRVLQDYCARAQAAATSAGRAAGAADPTAARLAAASIVARGLADGVRVTGPTGRPVLAVGHVPTGAADCGAGRVAAADGPWLSAVVPLTTSDGRPAGTAEASFSLSGGVVGRLRQAIGQGAVVLTDTAGTVVVASGGVRPGDVRRAQAGEQDLGGGRLVSWVSPERDQAFGVVVEQRRAGISPGLLALGLGVVAVAVLLAVAIALLSARATTQPLEELSQAAAKIAGGDLSTVIAVRSRDEVGRLAGTFNAMTADLRGYVGQLQASRRELQSGLVRLGDTLSSTHDLDRMLAVVLDSAMASTQAGAGMVLLLAPDDSHLVLAVSRGLDVPLDLRVPLGAGISGAVGESGEPLRGLVGTGRGEHRPVPGEPVGSTVIAVPLTSGGKVVGVLDLFGSAAPGGFSDDDLDTIRTFASQATVAVANVLLHEEAQRLSITDGLTGLWNYRYFTITMGKEIERATRFARPLALLMLDLDHFKGVNDTFGHPRGDAVLVELAARVQACVRDVDTVARYGGEEIVVILPETGDQGAGQLAARICEAVRRKPFGAPGEPPVVLTVSVGGAVFPQHGTAASTLLSRADQALYATKHAGRDGWQMSTSGASNRPH